MKVNLSSQVAIVTGGAAGIGRAIALVLAENGAQVTIVDIDAERARNTAREISDEGTPCVDFVADVADPAEMVQVANQVVDRFGRIDILINNAGINTRRDRVPVHEYNLEDWNKILEVDLTGVFIASRAIIPAMLTNKRGRIVNISSIAGLVPLRLQSAFVAAKAGVVNLTRSMALELGPQGILVNAVAPGSTLTAGTEALFYGPDGAYTRKSSQSSGSHSFRTAGSPGGNCVCRAVPW